MQPNSEYIDNTQIDEMQLSGGTRSSTKTVRIVLLALLTALTTIATVIFIIPFPSTNGYFNLGDSIVMISGLLLGPVGGFIAGGVGSALADVALGYVAFAPITFIVKGCEGLLVGLISRRTKFSQQISFFDFLGLLLGSIAMLIGYFICEIVILQIVWQEAFFELITINIIQVVAGSFVAIIVGPIVRKFLRAHLMD